VAEKRAQPVQNISFHPIHSVYVQIRLPGLRAYPEGHPSEYSHVLGEISNYFAAIP
jgi:hypothetical protein